MLRSTASCTIAMLLFVGLFFAGPLLAHGQDDHDEFPPDDRDIPTSDTQAVELGKIAEELCFQAINGFRPANPAAAPMFPGMTGTPESADPNSGKSTVTRTASKSLNLVLSQFIAGVNPGEGEKFLKIVNETVVSRTSPLGDTLRLSESYHELKMALSDRNGGPMTDADIDDLTNLIGNYLAPIRIRHTGNNFAPEDYCFRSTFETTARKFRLSIIKHGGKFLWYVDEGF